MPKIDEAQAILKALGLPNAQQNEISALTLLALVQVGPEDSWISAHREGRRISKELMAFMANRYGKIYAPNTRETVRRQVLHQFIQARITDYNPFNEELATNSSLTHYAISDAALDAIHAFGTTNWDLKVSGFLADFGALADIYAGRRSRGTRVPILLPDGVELSLSPGKHNQLQKAVIEEFAPRFAKDAKLLYLGDTSDKNLIQDQESLATVGLPVNEHDKLPDIVLLDQTRSWLLMIEAVTSHGPMTPKRVVELSTLFETRENRPVFVSAFFTMTEFRKHMTDIAWETEVWIAESPDHMIHFNGDRFLGPR